MSVLSGLTKADFKTASDGLLELSEERLRAVMRTEPITDVYHVEERPFARDNKCNFPKVRKQIRDIVATRNVGADGVMIARVPADAQGRAPLAAARRDAMSSYVCRALSLCRRSSNCIFLSLSGCRFSGPARPRPVSDCLITADRFRFPAYYRPANNVRSSMTGRLVGLHDSF